MEEVKHGEHPASYSLWNLDEASGKVHDWTDVIAQANAINDRPVVVDFIVSADAQVWPMVAAGVSNDEIQHARGMSPVWEEE